MSSSVHTNRTLVWDASAIHHPAKADRLDVIGDICRQWRNITTAAIVEELQLHGISIDGHSWLEVTHVDGLNEIVALGRWIDIVSSGQHNRGEATVLAWAEVHGAIAIIDDGDASKVGRKHGITVHGSLWVLAEAIRSGHLVEAAASGLVDALIHEGARFPFGRGQFLKWAYREGLLP
jgi:predicted nucleic acid-binding protein